MELGIIGVGRMGANMTRRLLRAGHRVTASDLSAAALAELAVEGAVVASSPSDLVGRLGTPRIVWLMLPAGEVTGKAFDEALKLLEPGDILVDGANSDWRDSRERAAVAEAKGVAMLDCGVSGGVWGLDEGFNLMVGGEVAAFTTVRPLLEALAAEGGVLHVGPAGSGHFVKMIHNGIEYALMEAYGEGFEALSAYPHAELDLPAIAALWQHGSVVRSWLLELTRSALDKDPRLAGVRGYVEDSGMGRWTVEYGLDQAVPMPAISAALFARFRSRQEDSFAARLAAALRGEFGGHAVREGEG